MNCGRFLAVLVPAALILPACFSPTPPTIPSQEPLGLSTQEPSRPCNCSNRVPWGVWEVSIDTATWEVTVVPIRGAQFTVDVVTFLQKPAGNPKNLTIQVTDAGKWMTEGRIDVDVILRHPFPGMTIYTGFDVYGVFMTPGSIVGRYDSDVVYTNGDTEPILLNEDGWSRWMNPVEFPDTGTIFDFTPGKLGTPNIGLFNSTANAYKYFADGVDRDTYLKAFFANPNKVRDRGKFSPGSINRRSYELKFPMEGGLPKVVFQYAVVASWVEPDPTLSGDPDVLDVPDDFPMTANADEAVFLDVADSSNLWFDGTSGGGSVKLGLEVYDWGAWQEGVVVADEIHQIVVEGDPSVIPGGYAIFDQATLAAIAAPGSSLISSVFEVEVTGCAPQSADDVPLLITVENEDPDTFDPGNGKVPTSDRLAAYFRHDVSVSSSVGIQIISPNGGETLWMALSHEITWTGGVAGDVAIEWSTDNFASDVRTIAASTMNNGSYTWVPIPNVETDTARVRVRMLPSGVSDKSDGDFSIAPPVWLDFQDEVEVDESTVSFNDTAGEPLGYHKAWDEFSPAISQDQDSRTHICWHAFGFDYNESGWWLRWGWDVGIRSMQGTSWAGENRFFQSSTNPDNQYEMRVDTMKLATAANNFTFAAVMLEGGAAYPKIYFCAYVDHYINPKSYYYNSNCVNFTPLVYQNCEVMADDDYLYMVGDSYRTTPITDQPGIYSLRVETPSCSVPWVYETLKILTESGEVSHSRSWAIHGGTLVLAYYTTDGKIKLLKQIDQTGDTWDDTEVIFDGTGYTGCKHPAIAVDGSDRLFALWTGQEGSSGDYHLLASMKETPSGSWTEPIVAATSSSPFDDQHITCSTQAVLLPTGDSEYLVLIGYQTGDIVYSQVSPKDLWAFLPTQLVSADGDVTRDPDTLCLAAPYLYDALFAWSFEVDEDNWDIKFRNADFETP